jgi:hypothetical protein
VRLGPWPDGASAVLHGGVARSPAMAARVVETLHAIEPAVVVREPAEDALAGALRLAAAIAHAH